MANNINVLQHMSEHCDTINEYLDVADITTKEAFKENPMVQDAVVMRLLALGELTTHLSDEFKETTANEIDWRNLKQLRNVIAHRYGAIQFDTIWEITQSDIPIIKGFCNINIKKLEDEINTVMQQKAKVSELYKMSAVKNMDTTILSNPNPNGDGNEGLG